MLKQKKNLTTYLQPQTATGVCGSVRSMLRVMVLVRSAGMNGTFSPNPRIPHLGIGLMGLFSRSALRITSIPFGFVLGAFQDTSTSHDPQRENSKTRGTGTLCLPLPH
jgi:hypothetical protein